MQQAVGLPPGMILPGFKPWEETKATKSKRRKIAFIWVIVEISLSKYISTITQMKAIILLLLLVAFVSSQGVVPRDCCIRGSNVYPSNSPCRRERTLQAYNLTIRYCPRLVRSGNMLQSNVCKMSLWGRRLQAPQRNCPKVGNYRCYMTRESC